MKTATLRIQSLLGAGTLAIMVFATAPLVQAALSDATFSLSAFTGQWAPPYNPGTISVISQVTSYQAGTITCGNAPGTLGATATILQGVDPYISASASSSSSTVGGATATYTYSFEVQGPAGGSIGVLVSANAGAIRTGTGVPNSSTGTMNIIGNYGDYNLGVLAGVVAGTVGSPGPGTLYFGFPYTSYPLTLSANTEYTVQLEVRVEAIAGIANAWIDPEISIDPAYLSANNLNPADYTLEFSPNFAPVPEPSTVIAGALALLPFGVSALRSLRKRQLA